jgi:hypothetical protein
VVRTLPDAKAQQRPAAKAKGPQQPQSQKETPAESPPPAKASP